MTYRTPTVTLALLLCCGLVQAQSQTLSFSLFSGTGPGAFNFSDFGLVQAVTLDDGGTSTSGPIVNLYEGSFGDTVFFYDHTTAGGTFVANNQKGGLFDENNTDVDGIPAPGDTVAVAVDDFNDFVFFTSRGEGGGTNIVYRAPLDPVTKQVSGPATPFLDFLLDPTALHITSGSRLLVGDAFGILTVDPNNANDNTFLSVADTQVRGLEEDVANGFIYFSTDGGDDIVRLPSAGGSPTVVLDGSGTGADGNSPSFQDILVDTVNDRLILADFASDGFFDVDGRILSFPLDRATGTLTNDPAVLLDQDGLQDPVLQNAYFTGLQFVPFAVGFPLSGDFNADGVVDAADYTVWRDNLGGDEAALGGVGDGSGTVDQGDYDLWAAKFGSAASAIGVPEPAAALLAAFGLLAMGRVRR